MPETCHVYQFLKHVQRMSERYSTHARLKPKICPTHARNMPESLPAHVQKHAQNISEYHMETKTNL